MGTKFRQHLCKTGISAVDVTGVGNAAPSPCRQRGHHQCRASAQVRSPCTRALQLPHRPDVQCASLHLHSGSKSRKTLCTAESPLKHHILDAAGAVGGKHGSSKQRRCVCCQCRVYPGKHSARAVQRARYGDDTTTTNAHMGPRALAEFCALSPECEQIMHQAFDSMALTARSYDRILRVARTIADLDGAQTIGLAHLAEAIQYRTYDFSVAEP